MTGLLLDTCAAIWLAEDEPLSDQAVNAINQAGQSGEIIYISPMTAWEIGLLVSRGRIAMSVTPEIWFSRLLLVSGIALAELSPRLLIASSFLPGSPPRDPADRIIVATAREKSLRLVTRDRAILAYAESGHLDALNC
jgi:PIN domain nuclease of toxin-antitoxin system